MRLVLLELSSRYLIFLAIVYFDRPLVSHGVLSILGAVGRVHSRTSCRSLISPQYIWASITRTLRYDCGQLPEDYGNLKNHASSAVCPRFSGHQVLSLSYLSFPAYNFRQCNFREVLRSASRNLADSTIASSMEEGTLEYNKLGKPHGTDISHRSTQARRAGVSIATRLNPFGLTMRSCRLLCVSGPLCPKERRSVKASK